MPAPKRAAPAVSNQEKYELGDSVKVTTNKGGVPVGHRGVITMIAYSSGLPGSAVYYQIRGGMSGMAYTVYAGEFVKLKKQTLYAYTDGTEEVHWATKKYSDKEMKEFGFTRATSFDKTMDLE